MMITIGQPIGFDWSQALLNVGSVLLGAGLAYWAADRQARKTQADELEALGYELFIFVNRLANDLMSMYKSLTSDLSVEDKREKRSSRV